MLSFLFISGFWALIGIFLLFWKKNKKAQVEIKVSSLELWRFALENSTHKKIRYKIPVNIWYVIFIYTLLVLALCHPMWTSANAHHIIVMDRSASMRTQVGNTTVFAKAIVAAQNLCESFSSTDTVELIVFPQKEVYRGNPSEISSVLSNCECTYLEGSVTSIVGNFGKSHADQIFVISDGAEKAHFPIAKHIFVGETDTNNLGFITFSSTLLDHNTWEIFFSLKNFSRIQQQTSVDVYVDNQVYTSFAFSLLGEEVKSNSVVLTKKNSKSIMLKIASNDNFPWDNVAYFSLYSSLKVWFSPQQQKILSPVVHSIPGIEVVAQKNADVIFASDAQEIESKQYGVLLNCKLPDMELANPIDSPSVIYSANKLLFGIFTPIMIATATPIKKSNYFSEPLFVTEQGTIMAAGKRYLYVGFDLQKCNWPESPSFVIFWYNYFDSILQQRQNFYYESLNNAFVEPGFFWEQKVNIARNFISEKESNNQGQNNLKDFSFKNIPKANSKISIQNGWIVVTIMALLILWYWQ